MKAAVIEMEDAIQILLQYGYVVLFVGMVVDALGIPFPGDLVLLASGYLVYRGEMNLALAIPIAFVAVLVGDSLTFAIGKALCHSSGTFLYRLYCRWTRCTLSSRDCFQRACDAFKLLGRKSIVLSKFMWGAREFIPPFAGLSGMQYRKFLALDALGIFLWVFSFVLAGRFLGMQAEALLGSLQDISLSFVVLIAVMVAVTLGVKKLKRNRHGKMDSTMEAPSEVRKSVTASLFNNED